MSTNAPRPLRRSARIAAQQKARSSPQGITKSRTRTPKMHPKTLSLLTSSNTTTSRLLSHPAEIRAMIWEEAFTSPTAILHFSPETRRFDVSAIGAGLLTACHLTAVETQHLAPRLNSLIFPSAHALLNRAERHARVEAGLGCVVEVKGVRLGG